MTDRQTTVNKTDTFHTERLLKTQADAARSECAFKPSGLYVTPRDVPPDYTHVPEHGNTGAFPKRHRRSSSSEGEQLFYFFDRIKAALMCRSDFFKKKKSYLSQTFKLEVYIILNVMFIINAFITLQHYLK